MSEGIGGDFLGGGEVPHLGNFRGRNPNISLNRYPRLSRYETQSYLDLTLFFDGEKGAEVKEKAAPENFEELERRVEALLDLSQQVEEGKLKGVHAFLNREGMSEGDFLIRQCEIRRDLIAKGASLPLELLSIGQTPVSWVKYSLGPGLKIAGGLPFLATRHPEYAELAKSVGSYIYCLHYLLAFSAGVGKGAEITLKGICLRQSLKTLDQLKGEKKRLAALGVKDEALSKMIEELKLSIAVEKKYLVADVKGYVISMGITSMNTLSKLNQVWSFLGPTLTHTLGIAASLAVIAGLSLSVVKQASSYRSLQKWIRDFRLPEGPLSHLIALKDKRAQRQIAVCEKKKREWAGELASILRKRTFEKALNQLRLKGIRLEEIPGGQKFVWLGDRSFTIKELKVFLEDPKVQKSLEGQFFAYKEKEAALNRLMAAECAPHEGDLEKIKEKLKDQGLNLDLIDELREVQSVAGLRRAAGDRSRPHIRRKMIEGMTKAKEAKSIVTKRALRTLIERKHAIAKKHTAMQLGISVGVFALVSLAVGIGITLKILALTGVLVPGSLVLLIPGVMLFTVGIGILATSFFCFARYHPNLLKSTLRMHNLKLTYRKIGLYVDDLRLRRKEVREMCLQDKVVGLGCRAQELESVLERLERSGDKVPESFERRLGSVEEMKQKLQNLKSEVEQRLKEKEEEHKKIEQEFLKAQERFSLQLQRVNKWKRKIEEARWKDFLRETSMTEEAGNLALLGIVAGLLQDEAFLDEETLEVLKKQMGIDLKKVREQKIPQEKLLQELKSFFGQRHHSLLGFIRSQHFKEQAQIEIAEKTKGMS